MQEDVQALVSFCPQCQLTQKMPDKENRKPVYHRVRDLLPFESWGIDLIGELPKSLNGNRWIICAVDYATGWPVVEAVPEASAEVVANFIYERIFKEYGPLRKLTSDNGPQFVSDIFTHLMQ